MMAKRQNRDGEIPLREWNEGRLASRSECFSEFPQRPQAAPPATAPADTGAQPLPQAAMQESLDLREAFAQEVAQPILNISDSAPEFSATLIGSWCVVGPQNWRGPGDAKRSLAAQSLRRATK